ncbi:MAG TPA: Mobilization protein mobB [Thiomonas arsenitoxydans]|uniref:Mobilization protein mobB n=2 Tax=Thiomonas TaxID=32012 RepID=A0A238D2J5_THIDL|nr:MULTISPECIES: Mobilization protein mobB [Thiomonas]CQR44808.1 conserved hypothetical protein [Thiomonas sp. CB3]MBN8744644.1 Mobilization protein mobB [Thiomonas arsenitoxydans]ODU91473.1 MAG: Mobilization protein mobB [Thiomonas sp. SCN 64-16]CDW92580.1 conserved hypothetical protein [Thiomonas sp. CB2]SBP87508.1 conserved hypothetical protein [Thiomonas delicata]
MDPQDRKPHTVRVRLTTAQLADLRHQAQAARKSVSELIRLRATLQPVISRADDTAAQRIDQLGRLLKHLYPKDKGWATGDDRRRWWQLVEELQRTAAILRRTP